MNETKTPNYAGYRFPPEIIAHTVWLYFRFALRYRDVEELLAERGVVLTYETVRQWCRKFGQGYANALRRRRPRPGDKWHLDQVFIKINGQQHYLWRAVDQDGQVLDILVQSRRDKAAARKFFRRLLKSLAYVPRVVITDRLASYGATRREVLPSVEHRQHKRLNNRAEHSHQPTRERERRMRRFKSPGQAQRFLAAYGPIADHFRPRRHRLTATAYRHRRDHAFATWREVTGVVAVARSTDCPRPSTPTRDSLTGLLAQVDDVIVTIRAIRLGDATWSRSSALVRASRIRQRPPTGLTRPHPHARLFAYSNPDSTI